MKKKTFINNLITFLLVTAAFVIAEIMMNNGSMSRSLKGQLVPICVYIVLALSLNLTVGISGELSLGHAAFMCIGAFTGAFVYAIVTGMATMTKNPPVSPVLSLIIPMLAGGIVAGLFGFLIGIPVLRLRGDYLAIVTLAFGEIIRNLLKFVYVSMDKDTGHLFFAFSSETELAGKEILSGANGTIVKNMVSVDTRFAIGFGLIIFTLFIVLNLVNSRTGRAIMATRDNRIAAESVGINVTQYKMIAFVISAALAGMAGALYGLNISKVKPDEMGIDKSILILVFVVLGGIGSMRGSVIAAALLTVLPTWLQTLNEQWKLDFDFDKYYMLIYAIVLILVMVVGNNKHVKQFMTSVKEKIAALFRKKEDPVKTGSRKEAGGNE